METSNANRSHITSEIKKRRTFAIISHPDAGKTTLTEKLLLYSGMIRTAGMVRARKGGKSTVSDWMSLEQERGISISASAMQFHYKDCIVNVLDTPGHQDFSEDTYRTLTAADSAVMVLDAGKGVEIQTRKLFAVCRLRGIPILTFINKLDLAGKEPLDLLHEVEDVLKIHSSPFNWPIGQGQQFRGVVDLKTKEALLFQKAAGGANFAPTRKIPLADLNESMGIYPEVLAKLHSDLELLEVAGNPFDQEKYLCGDLTPVFFGSALTNFGIEPFFDSFVKLAPPPRAAKAFKENGEEIKIDPTSPDFSAFIFKLQANVNPRHRDSMAYMRICSGEFERDMTVWHNRLKKEIRLSHSFSLVAQERSTVDVAFAGDIVGVNNPGIFQIGDSLSIKPDTYFPPLPSFPPEVIGTIRPTDVMRHKSFEKGIQQLSMEGTVQLLRSFKRQEDPPYVAAVGQLQFEVLQHRLKEEYNVNTKLELLPYRLSAYLEGDPKTVKLPQSATLALDSRDKVVVLFCADWEKRYAAEQNPAHVFLDFVCV